jgi:hypothetical protein
MYSSDALFALALSTTSAATDGLDVWVRGRYGHAASDGISRAPCARDLCE